MLYSRYPSALYGLLAALTAGFAREPTYFVYFPKCVSPGFPIQIVAEILQYPNPVNITASLKSSNGEIDFVCKDTLIRGDSKQLVFHEQISIGYDGSTELELSILGVDALTNDTVIKNSTATLAYGLKSLSIFIQTDKGIYKPSQTIKFRAVVMKPDLLPYNGSVFYKLTDPDNNIVLQGKNSILINGIAGSEFTLGRYSTLGTWKIAFECQGNEKAVTVQVDEYQLPKFEIQFSPNQLFLHPDSKEYSGKFGARFTFGQPVRGEASITFTVDHFQYNFFWNNEISSKSFDIQYSDFKGEAVFSVPMDDLKSKLAWNPQDQPQKRMMVIVRVRDKNSQTQLDEKSHVDLVQIPVKVENINTPASIKPGLLYTAYLRVTQHDASRITEQQRQSFGMSIKYSYVYSTPNVHFISGYINAEIGEDGFVTVRMRANNSNYDSVSFQVESKKYEDQYFMFWNSKRFVSPSNTFIQLSTLNNSLKPDKKAVFDVLTSRDNMTYSIMMMSRGTIVKQETYTPNDYMDEDDLFKFQYEFVVTNRMAPSVSVTFYFDVENGELVADNIVLNVEKPMKNKISLSTNVTNTETGTPISVTVQTDPNSSIGLRAIDRGVILQKEGNDITADKVVDELRQYSIVYANNHNLFYHYQRSSADNAKEVFRDAGVIVFTDAAIFLSQESDPVIVYEDDAIDPVDYDAVDDNTITLFDDTGADDNIVETVPKVRKNFPETWIWEESVTESTGMKTYTFLLPDTTTTWEISAFAISPSTGLGILNPDSQITASRDFFISLALPPTMISGEILSLKTTVYNFLDTGVKARLTLQDSEWYELVMNGDNKNIEGSVRDITIPSKDGQMEIFSIRFKKTGYAKIKFIAKSEAASDAVERILHIKPEGIEKVISKNALVERDSNGTEETVTVFEVNIPAGVVEGSVYGRLSVSGNILGNSWNNLDNLLKLPSGCGEQTMLSFAPDVFISQYLKKVGLLEGEVERKSTKHIVAGYQNELRYQHQDGGFSAFGGITKFASTWLTAFVVKCFIAARELNPDFAHEETIDPAINFLLTTQQDDGSFKEKGVVWHRDMQGGVRSHDTMTAYVLIALIEGDYKKNEEKVINAIDKAKRYLEGNVDDIDDTYALSVIAYALVLSGSSSTNRVIDRLQQMAKRTGNLKYWAGPEAVNCETKSRSDVTNCWDADASSSDIEMTSYALLALIEDGKANESMPIVRWIVKQRGSLGGYRSTQDTVMAIQALSLVAGLYTSNSSALTVDVQHSAANESITTMYVTNENAIVLQNVELSPIAGVVTVKTDGVGLADLLLSYQYHLPLQGRANEPFSLSLDLAQVDGYEKLQLNICSSVNKEADNPLNGTGMYVVAVTLPSGYSSDTKDTSSFNTATELVELVGNEVTGYFNKLSTNEELCFVIQMNRFLKVGNMKPQMVRAFDYYKPDVMSLRTYAPPGSDNLCDAFGKDLHGCHDGNDAVKHSAYLMFITILVGYVSM